MYKSKFFKVVFLIIVLAIVVSLGLFGCKTTEEEAEEIVEKVEEAVEDVVITGITAPENEVTVDLWFQEWAGGQSWLEAYVPVFEEKYPTIDINLIFLPFEELNTKIFPAIAAGNEADLMYMYDDWLLDKDVSKIFGAITPDLYSFEELGKVAYSSALSRVVGSDGEVYAVPFLTGANGAGIIIHKDLFDEEGIDPASIKDWDDVKEAAEKLTKYNDDGSISRSGILFTYTESANVLLDFITEQTDSKNLLNTETGEWDFSIPEAKNAIEMFKYFVDEKLFDPASGDPFTAFPNQLGAMLVIGPWSLGAWGDQYPDLELDYISMPNYPGTDDNVHNVVSWGTIAISQRLESEKRDAALLFIKDMLENPEFFNIPFANGYWVGVPGSQAYVNELLGLTEAGNAPNRAAEIAAQVTSDYVPSIALLPTKISEPELIRTVIYPEMESVFIGSKTVDEMLAYLTSTLTAKEQELME